MYVTVQLFATGAVAPRWRDCAYYRRGSRKLVSLMGYYPNHLCGASGTEEWAFWSRQIAKTSGHTVGAFTSPDRWL